MLFAGIDEAGYGPILGPLVVGCCMVELDGDEAMPDLWHRLRKVVSAKRDRTGRRLHVADSKKVYSPSIGLAELEKSVLAFAGNPIDLDALLAATTDDRPTAAWYEKPDDESHPATLDPATAAIAANALRHELAAAGVTGVRLRARVVYEGEYNRLCAATRNKSAVLQSVTAGLMHDAITGGDDVTLVCDRHGGRSRYGPFLRTMFPDHELSVDAEADGRGDYTLARGQATARVVFAEKAETLALPTALASMAAKYLRERLMGRLNAWWSDRVPGLRPTAGYWTDGLRFLGDVADARRELGVADVDLVRER